MAFRARFALLLFVVMALSTRCLFAQETHPKKPADSAAPDRTADEEMAKARRLHCEIPECVQKVLYFSDVSQPSELQDVTNAMRVIAEISRVQQIPAARIIIIEGTAEQVAIAERIAAEIDRDKRRFGGLGYRIDVKIQESEGDKKGHSRLFSLVSEARDAARVCVGRQAVVAQAQGQNEAASEGKQSTDSSNTCSIESRILAENEHSIELSVEVAFARDSVRETGAGASPLLRLKEHVTVELDKPTFIGRIDDPDGDRSFTIELTASRIKER